ncbi:MAG: glycosyltransferase family 39 protein [Chloroflexota bacterium]
MKKHKLNFFPWLIIGVILLLSLVLRCRYVWVTPMEFDEGHWLMFGVLANAGYPAYTETFVGIPPLALLTIQLGDALFGYSSLALRYPMMLYSLIGIAGIYWIFTGWRGQTGLLAGALAALFVATDADALRGSGTIMAEIPAMSLAALSLALAWQYYYDRHKFWLLLSGVTFTLSVALKIFVVFLPVVIAVLMAFAVLPDYRRDRRLAVRRLIVLGSIWLGGVLIPLIPFLLMYDPAAMYEQVYLFRLVVRHAYLSTGLDDVSTLENISRIGQMMLRRGPLVVGTLLGSVIGWKQRRVDVTVWLTWLCLAALLLTSHAPLRGRYSVLLLPPLAALSGLTLASITEWGFFWLRQKWPVRKAGLLIGLLVGGLVLVTLMTPLRLALAAPAPDTFAEDMRPERLDAINYARSSTSPDDCLITDDQRFAFRADRLVPPAMSETSKALLLAGWLTTADIVREVKAKDCAMVVYALGRFDDFLPDLREQLRHLYYLEIRLANNTVIYTARKDIVSVPSIPMGVQFGEAVILEGIDVLPSPARAGQEISLVTYWSAAKPVSQSYKIFLQLRNSQNQVIAGLDHFPFPAPNNTSGKFYQVLPSIDPRQYTVADVAVYPRLGMLPTKVWPVGKTLREVTTFTLPANLPAGTYRFFIGLYHPDTLTRVPINNTDGDAFLLTSVEVIDTR